MVLTEKQKAVIENDFIEKGWNAHKIWQEHPSFECSRMAIHNLIKKIKETGSTDRKKGGGRPVTATTEENGDLVEELICSQEENHGTHSSARKIAPQISISRSSVQRLVVKRKLRCYKRMKTPQLNDGCRKRRTERASKLFRRFTVHSIPRLVFQDEKDFTLQVKTNHQNNRVYHNGPKADVEPKRLFSERNKQSIKVMVSAIFSWKGVSQPFFVGGSKIKVNAESYLKHLRDDLIPAAEAMYPHNDFTFVQDSAPSHRANKIQKFLIEKLKSRFVKNTDWPPSSPDCNPLDFYFWNRVQERVFEGRHCSPFQSVEELEARIKEVWDECASDLKEIRKALKQFLPRLQAVESKDGGSIKTLFG